MSVSGHVCKRKLLSLEGVRECVKEEALRLGGVRACLQEEGARACAASLFYVPL